MPAHSHVVMVGRFIRSLLPRSPLQIVVVVGALLLYSAPHMVWWIPRLEWDDPSVILGWKPEPDTIRPLPALVMRLSSFLAMGAGFASILLCFSALPNPVRFYRRWILPFTLPVLFLYVFNHLFSQPRPQSVFDDDSLLAAPVLDNVLSLFSQIGPGFYAALACLAALGFGVWKQKQSSSLLPVVFATEPQSRDSIPRQNEMLRFVLLAYLLTFLSAIPLGLMIWLSGSESGELLWLMRFPSIISSFPIAALALWFLRRESWQSLFRLPAPRYLLLGLAIPVVAYAIPRIARYCWLEIAHYFRPAENYGPPEFWAMFPAPPVWSLFMLLPALLEEIGWRGYLQRRMTTEFGMRRGLFLVGIAWSVWHLPGEVADISVSHAAGSIAVRFVSVFAILVPIGWLFCRTGSVIPVTILHALSNSLRGSGTEFGIERTWIGWGQVVILALCGLWLFKRWPVTEPATNHTRPAEVSKSGTPAERSPA